MNLKNISSFIFNAFQLSKQYSVQNSFQFKPTVYLTHPFLQSIYNLAQPKINMSFHRQRLFFEDGGHISLDWAEDPNKTIQKNSKKPILFLMHGLTGGSEMNYIKSLMKEGEKEGYRSVCMNSRGINNKMTSPIPFTGMSHHELSSALDRVEIYYPNSPIYMVGTSFGGNYILRYLLNHHRPSIKGLATLAPPFNVTKAINDMPPIYQKFFVKRYVEETLRKHPQMNYWNQIGLVNMEKALQSKDLKQFYSYITAPILGLDSADALFNQYNITSQQIQDISIPMLLMASKDDPIVSFNSFPIQEIKKNKNIELMVTEKGGHLCWFEGIIPRRWYPKPTLNFFKKLQNKQN